MNASNIGCAGTLAAANVNVTSNVVWSGTASGPTLNASNIGCAGTLAAANVNVTSNVVWSGTASGPTLNVGVVGVNNVFSSNLSWSNIASGFTLNASNISTSNIVVSKQFTGSNMSTSNLVWSNATGSNLTAQSILTTNMSYGSAIGTSLNVQSVVSCNIVTSNVTFNNAFGSNLSVSNISYTRLNFNGVGGTIVMSNGQIGVGTVTPAYPVDIVGSINLTGNIYQNGVLTTLTTSGSSTFSNITATSGVITLLTSCNVNYAPVLNFTSGSGGPLIAMSNGSLVIGSNLNVLGQILQNGVPFVSGSSFSNSNGLWYSWSNNGQLTTSNVALSMRTSNMLALTCSNGFVGIGAKSNPVFTFDVAGDINFSGNIYQNGAPLQLSGSNSSGSSSNVNVNINTIGNTYSNISTGTVYATNVTSVGLTILPLGSLPSAPSIPTTTVVPTLVASNIGIGLLTPTYPLHVVTTNGSNVSGFFTGQVITQQLMQFSDSRIKTNFVDVDADQAKDIVRKLNVSTYDYIEKGKKRRTGFVAQELEQFFPECVQEITEFIPNIYANASVLSPGNVLGLAPAPDSFTNVLVGDVLKIYVGKSSVIVKVTEVRNDSESKSKKSLVVDNVFEVGREVFVFGTQVDDFKVIAHEPILALLVKCVQALL